MIRSSKLKFCFSNKIFHAFLMMFCVISCFLLFAHPDIFETSNHSYLFLESMFKGKFFDYYSYVAAHENTYYYINNAHYNIIVYTIFAIWQLPVFIINFIFGLALNEQFLWLWSKAVSVGFYIACGYMVRQIGKALNMSDANANASGLFFIFNPISFLGAVVMGQYDSMCIFFTLAALLFYLKGDYTKFCLMAGVGIVCKFFPLIIVVFLIVLAEKRILHIIKYLAITMWLYVLTSLLFLGKTGNAAAFNSQMIERVFTNTVDTSAGAVSVLVLILAVLLVGVFLYTPKAKEQKNYLAVYLPLVLMSVLFINVEWHPQWLTLMIQFLVLTTFMQKNKQPWFILDIVMSVGFVLVCFIKFPNHMGAALFDGGIFNMMSGIRVTTSSAWVQLDHFVGLIPYIYEVSLVMLTGAMLANIIFKIPYKSDTVCNVLSQGSTYDKLSTKQWGYAIFGIGFVLAWLIPVVAEMLNALSVI